MPTEHTENNSPVPADPDSPDLPGEPIAGDLPRPVGQQEPVDDEAADRAADAARRIKNDPRT